MIIRIRLFIATLFYGLCLFWHLLDVLCERIANKIAGVDTEVIRQIKKGIK